MLDPEDEKLVVLARATRSRVGAAAGAAVRDELGRTYAGATVDRGSFRLSAPRVALALALSSGASGFEAVAVVGSTDVGADDESLLRELGIPLLVLADPTGELRESRSLG